MKKKRGELKKVSDLFQKYKTTLQAPEKTVIVAFIEVVDDVLGVQLSPERVRYNPLTKTLSITGKAALKSEIQFNRVDIINHLKGRLGPKNAPETIL